MAQQTGRLLLACLGKQGWAAQQQHATASLTALRPWSQVCCYHAKPTILIKELREKSGAPISDVKKSLEEANWDLDKAYEVLRKRGLAAAAKKASRHAADGLVGVAVGPGAAVIVEVNSETDFVARNELFTGLVQQVAQAALSLGPSAAGPGHTLDAEALSAARTSSGATVADACAEVAAKMRENIKLRRAFLMASPGVISPYIHTAAGPGLGRIIGLVALEGPSGSIDEVVRPQVEELANSLAMHAVGMRAQYLSRDTVPADVLQRERQLLSEQAAASGKPAAVVQKMVEGRLGKFYEEACLLEQKFLLDDSQKVAGVVKAAAGKLGVELRVAGMLRVQVGEGLQTGAAKDFASEVAEMAASG